MGGVVISVGERKEGGAYVVDVSERVHGTLFSPRLHPTLNIIE
jgi:hypothetical protein